MNDYLDRLEHQYEEAEIKECAPNGAGTCRNEELIEELKKMISAQAKIAVIDKEKINFLVGLISDLYEVSGWLMKGIGYITIPDYGKLNGTFVKAEIVINQHKSK